MKFRKYPKVISPRELKRLVDKVPELADFKAYLQPKYDGSNITVYKGEFRTRNLLPLPPNFEAGIREAFAERQLISLMELSEHLQIFFELGGRGNAPAGYEQPWSRKWEHVVFDMMIGDSFIPASVVGQIAMMNGLNFAPVYEVVGVDELLDEEEWVARLKDKRRYWYFEGFVAKIYPEEEVLEKLRALHHRQYNAVIVKFKHDYTDDPGGRVREVKKIAGEEFDKRAPVLHDSEVFGAINKAHLELGDEICDKRKAMKTIIRYVNEEAKKHGMKPPKGGRLYQMYLEYLDRMEVRCDG